MIWDKPITADGHTATPEQLQKAWARWVRNLPEDASLLTGILCSEGAGTNARPWRCSRIADRMLQKARKAGAIRYEKGQWRIMEPRP